MGQDADLRALRERREWLDALEKAKGGVSTRALIGARAEARAPFRLARLFIFGGLGAGAALGLAVIAGRLIAALKGGSIPCLGSRDTYSNGFSSYMHGDQCHAHFSG